MPNRIEISAYAAIPAMLALAAGAYLMKPAEFRRDPLLEAQALVGLAVKYEAMYAGCDDGTDGEDPLSAAGLAKGFAGGYAHRFPARSDEDARAFATSARPQCGLAALYRLDHRLVGNSAGRVRYRRTRVE